jgi:uncharacterized protein YfeS
VRESMSGDPKSDLTREDCHPKARTVLTDAFIWDLSDPCSPFGDESGLEMLEAFRDFRAESPRGNPITVLDEMLERWEIVNDHWEVVTAAAVHAIGAEDEISLLLRDEAILALAFAQLVVEGRIDPEVRRRALLALTRQALPALLHGWGDLMNTREARLWRMREIIGRRWD